MQPMSGCSRSTVEVRLGSDNPRFQYDLIPPLVHSSRTLLAAGSSWRSSSIRSSGSCSFRSGYLESRSMASSACCALSSLSRPDSSHPGGHSK